MKPRQYICIWSNTPKDVKNATNSPNGHLLLDNNKDFVLL